MEHRPPFEAIDERLVRSGRRSLSSRDRSSRAAPIQAKLICDATGQRFLLGFRSDAPDDPNGNDYVDSYRVRFTPTFTISPRVLTRHVSFLPGDTGFASTGPHYVDETGRPLLLSPSPWSDDVGPGGVSYVSRIDELASA
jgi:hypothetical protein